MNRGTRFTGTGAKYASISSRICACEARHSWKYASVTSARQHAIDDHAIHGEAVQREIDEGALRFAQHHALRIGDQADAGDLGIFQQLADAVEAAEQILDVGEVAVGGQFHRRDAIGERPHGLQDAALERERCASCTTRAWSAC